MEKTGDNLGLVPMNPIEEIDKQIASLERTGEIMKTQATEISDLKEALSKSASELKAVTKDHNT